MSDEPSANAPIELPEVLQKELESFGFAPAAVDPMLPAEDRLKAGHRQIRAVQPERSVLCISGGGIRSATFALGVVQALAKAGLLTKFDYLSTVSGGGYLGSMLSAGIHSHPRKLEGVAADLAGACAPGQATPVVGPLRHLRQFSNYIAPKLGLFSADGWTLAATALRNLLLNWTVLVLLLAGLLVLPWLGRLGVLAKPTIGHRSAARRGLRLHRRSHGLPGLDLPSQGCFRWRQKWFLAGWLVPLLAGILCLCSWWAGRTNYYASSEAEAARYLAHPLKDATQWMERGDGLAAIAAFLVAASVSGILVCAAITLVRDARRGQLQARFSWPQMRKLAGLIVASVLVLGTPGTALLWVMAVKFFPSPGSDAVPYITLAPAALLLGFFLLNSLFVGVTSRCSDDDDREWFAAKIGASSKTPAIFESNPAAKKNVLLSAAAVGFFALLACGVSLMLDHGFFATTILDCVAAEATRDSPAPLHEFVQRHAVLTPSPFTQVPLLFVPVTDLAHLDCRAACALLADPMKPWNDKLNDRKTFDRFGYLLQFPEVYLIFGKKLALVLLLLFATGFTMGFFVNVNRFSLHATYRNRLVRAYLGAARAFTGADGRPLRKPHPFTGFDPDDNLEIAKLDHPRPLHVVNMTLNLVGGDELAWQERKADSFTATRLHTGNRRLGYRPSDKYADGLSLGTALAISGAAASPNQGYNSSALITFLMTLFNVRLGWWLGNPGLRGSKAWTRPGPAQATLPLFTEAFGLTNENRAYVNLSDGGHFENLAIYEMLIRRCRFLVVSDAEQDGDYHFDGLGGIVRKARIDLGVTIEFTGLAAVSKATPEAQRRCFALGTVRYPEGLEGRILYLKPLLLPTVPTDVRHYAETHAAFPHESTGDQFFSESQFEAYRALGQHEMAQILAPLARPPSTIADLFARLEET